MAYSRVTAIWSGGAGLPGYTRMKFNGDLDTAGAAAAAARMRVFFDAIKTLLPTPVSINFAETAQVYSTLGVLEGEVAFTPPAPVIGTGSGSYAAPVGMVVNWITGAFLNGRKVRGRTFLVPLTGSAFTTDGTPSTTAQTALQGAAAALAGGSPPLVIQSFFGEDNAAGAVTSVTGASVPDRSAVLRSRRD